MLKNYLTTAWRNLRQHKTHSFINISGLAIGMAVAMLIGLWIWDELTFDQYNPNYKRVAQVMQHQTFNGVTGTQKSIPRPLGQEMRKTYGGDFKSIVMSSWIWPHVVTVGDKKLNQSGCFMEAGGPEIYGFSFVEGSSKGLESPGTILISQSLARALFGETDPLNKTVRIDNQGNFAVNGVYADPPANSWAGKSGMSFIAPWIYYADNVLEKRTENDWGDNSFQLFVQLADNAEMASVSKKIKDAKLNQVGKDEAKFKPALFLQPMSQWWLHSQFKNGVQTGGRIQYVWLFGIIGGFVLLLACINFMNLSTARSEKRAKEVGIRKTVGSLRGQLISQFYTESILIAGLAFVLALLLTWLFLPFFNTLADKKMVMPWDEVFFWGAGLLFVLVTGLIAGSYPALYLSSFRPVKVLKGAFKAGRYAAAPRQVLVVLQFSVSVILIVGTLVVLRQINFAKDRPVGYTRAGLVNMQMATDDLHNHMEAFKTDLLKTGAVAGIAESSSPATGINNSTTGIEWTGKDPSMASDFANIWVASEYGKTVGWEFVAGRDFSAQMATDTAALILNEAAVKYMNLKNPLGENVKVWGKDYRVVGVVRDMVTESPFEPVRQTIFRLSSGFGGYLNIKINPNVSAHTAMQQVEEAYKVYSPADPFTYKFVDLEYAKKFADDERTGKLAGVFAVLAVFISCLGLFGMASFMAEQRIKEIGVRKVLGASVVNLWGLLNKDFVALVGIALAIALPLSWYLMHSWLQHYTYRTEIVWWIPAGAGVGALLITLLTVSYQSVKAALANPVKSLRSE